MTVHVCKSTVFASALFQCIIIIGCKNAMNEEKIGVERKSDSSSDMVSVEKEDRTEGYHVIRMYLNARRDSNINEDELEKQEYMEKVILATKYIVNWSKDDFEKAKKEMRLNKDEIQLLDEARKTTPPRSSLVKKEDNKGIDEAIQETKKRLENEKRKLGTESE